MNELLATYLRRHRWLLEGFHLSSPDETFSKCRVKVPYLEDWLGVSIYQWRGQ
jgi:hypothetical protein